MTKFSGYLEHRWGNIPSKFHPFLCKFTFSPFTHIPPILVHFHVTHSLDINLCPLFITKTIYLISMKNDRVEGWDVPSTMLHISWKFGQKILFTTQVIALLKSWNVRGDTFWLLEWDMYSWKPCMYILYILVWCHKTFKFHIPCFQLSILLTHQNLLIGWHQI